MQDQSEPEYSFIIGAPLTGRASVGLAGRCLFRLRRFEVGLGVEY